MECSKNFKDVGMLLYNVNLSRSSVPKVISETLVASTVGQNRGKFIHNLHINELQPLDVHSDDTKWRFRLSKIFQREISESNQLSSQEDLCILKLQSYSF